MEHANQVYLGPCVNLGKNNQANDKEKNRQEVKEKEEVDIKLQDINISLPSLPPNFFPQRELKEIEEHLKENKACVLYLYGSPGVGKTTIARKAAELFSSKQNNLVIWVEFQAKISHSEIIDADLIVRECFSQIAKLLKLGTNAQNTIEIVKSVFNEIEDLNKNCLLILNNIETDHFKEKLNIVHELINYQKNKIKILLTTRANILISIQIFVTKKIEITELTKEEAMIFLCNFAVDEENAKKLIDKIGCLPLFLADVCRIIESTNGFFTVDQFLNECSKSLKNTPSAHEYNVTGYSIYKTIVDKLIECESSIEDFLIYCSYLSSSNIPTNFIKSLLKDNFLAILQKVQEVSLIYNKKSKNDFNLFSIHPLVHEIIRDIMLTKETTKTYIATKNLLESFTEFYPFDYNDIMVTKRNNWLILRELFPHAIIFLSKIKTSIESSSHEFFALINELYHNLGVFCNHVLSDYKKASGFLTTALSNKEKNISVDKESILNSRIELADSEYRKSNFVKAIQLFFLANKEYDEILQSNKTYPSIFDKSAFTKHAFANVYYNIGEYNKANELLLLSEQLRKEYLEEDDIWFGLLYHDQANVCVALGKYKEANDLFKKAEKIKTNVYKSETSNLALLYQWKSVLYIETGEFKPAIEYLKRAKEIYELNIALDFYRNRLYKARIFLMVKKFNKSLKVLKIVELDIKQFCGGANIFISKVYYELAFLYLQMGDFKSSLICIDNGVENIRSLSPSAKDISMKFQKARLLSIKAVISAAQGFYDKANKLINKALSLKVNFHNTITKIINELESGSTKKTTIYEYILSLKFLYSTDTSEEQNSNKIYPLYHENIAFSFYEYALVKLLQYMAEKYSKNTINNYQEILGFIDLALENFKTHYNNESHFNIVLTYHLRGIVNRLIAISYKKNEIKVKEYLEKSISDLKIVIKSYKNKLTHPYRVYSMYELGFTFLFYGNEKAAKKLFKKSQDLILKVRPDLELSNHSKVDEDKQVDIQDNNANYILDQYPDIFNKKKITISNFYFFKSQFNIQDKPIMEFGFLPMPDTMINRYP